MLSYFRRYITSEKVGLLAFVGPFSLLLTLSLTLNTNNNSLWLTTIFSFLLLVKYQRKSLFFSIPLLVATSLWAHLFFPISHMFHLGVELSVLLGLLITAFSMEEIKDYVDLMQSSVSSAKSEQEKLAENFEEEQRTLTLEHQKTQKRLFELEDNYSALQKEFHSQEELMQTIAFARAQEQDAKEELLHDLAVKTKELEELKLRSELKVDVVDKATVLSLENEKRSLLDEIHRKEEMISSLKSSLDEFKSEQGSISTSEIVELKQHQNELLEKLQSKDEVIYAHETKLQQLAQIEPIYFQLRKQFDEKNEYLHTLRSSLFHAEGQLEALRKEKEEAKLSWDSVIDSAFNEADKMTEEFERNREEIESLLEIITTLSKPSKEPVNRDKDLLY